MGRPRGVRGEPCGGPRAQGTLRGRADAERADRARPPRRRRAAAGDRRREPRGDRAASRSARCPRRPPSADSDGQNEKRPEGRFSMLQTQYASAADDRRVLDVDDRRRDPHAGRRAGGIGRVAPHSVCGTVTQSSSELHAGSPAGIRPKRDRRTGARFQRFLGGADAWIAIGGAGAVLRTPLATGSPVPGSTYSAFQVTV